LFTAGLNPLDSGATPAHTTKKRKKPNTPGSTGPRAARAPRTTAAQQQQQVQDLLGTVSQLMRMVTQLGHRLTAFEQNRDLAQHTSITDLKRCFMVFLPKSKHNCPRDVEAFSTITAGDIAEVAGHDAAAFTILGRGRTWLRVSCDTQDLKHHVMKAQTRRLFTNACGVTISDDLSPPERADQKRLSLGMKALYSANYKPS
jgi:hypothetical protein